LPTKKRCLFFIEEISKPLFLVEIFYLFSCIYSFI